MRLNDLFESSPLLIRTDEDAMLSERLRKVNGRWALVSRKDPNKVLQYYHGSGHPSLSGTRKPAHVTFIPR